MTRKGLSSFWRLGPKDRQALEKGLKELASREVYLTGGAVRDILRGQKVQDLDLTVLESPEPLAREIAQRLSWTLIPLHEEFGLWRIARGSFTVDLSGLRPGASDLWEDLRLRDFTFNALAVKLEKALYTPPENWPLIDPARGVEDLKKGIIRALSQKNLEEDPLRILRAYRFQAWRYGKIEEETRSWLRELKAQLLSVAAERIEHELRLIMESSQGGKTVRLMAEDGVLDVLFPEISWARGVPQPSFHHLDVFGHLLLSLEWAERILGRPEFFWEDPRPFRELLLNPERVAAVKWAALFHDLGKPYTLVFRERLTFYEHEKVGAELFWKRAQALRFKKRLAQRVVHLIRHHMRPFHLLEEWEEGRLTARAQRKLLRDVPDYPDLFVVAMADSLAAQGPDKDPKEFRRLARFFEHLRAFQRENLKKVEKKRLVTGRDLIEIWKLKPGPLFRVLLEAVEEAQVEGQVKTRSEALRFLDQKIKALKREVL